MNRSPRPSGRPGRAAGARPPTWWGRAGLRSRLFVGLMIVVVIEACVLGAVAALVGPTAFADRLGLSGAGSEQALEQARAAYLGSVGIALSAGLVVAVVGGAVAAWLIASRLTRPLRRFSRAAQAVSAGDYTVRVDSSALGPEFDQLEAAFGEMTRRLAATEEARTQLIADLSHEMRTPLMTLMTYIEALEDGVRPPLATTWEVMGDQVRRLTRLTQDMAQASADTEAALVVEKHPLDVARLVERTVWAWRAGQLGARLEIDVHLPGEPVLAHVDAARIEQVLTNLIDNAARHARGAGRIDITVQGREEEVLLAVEDDGAGIAPADRPRVFDRFFRADRSRTGTGAGLGLAISRSIVQAHGGSLVLEEGAAGGARFVAVLPR